MTEWWPYLIGFGIASISFSVGYVVGYITGRRDELLRRLGGRP